MAVREEESSSGTVSRVIRLLAALAEHGGEIGPSELGERVGLAPSTAHRLLGLLKDEDIVQWNPNTRGYFPGPEFYRIASRLIGSLSVPDLARPYVEELAARFNETVLFGQFLKARDAMSFAVRFDGQQMLQYKILMDEPLSLLWGASGKVILAQLPDEDVQRIHRVAEASPASQQEPPSLLALQSELASIREFGFAMSDNEKLPGARGIAAPVFSNAGVVGCLVLTSPRERLPHGEIEEICIAIVEAAAHLSDVLGARDRKPRR